MDFRTQWTYFVSGNINSQHIVMSTKKKILPVRADILDIKFASTSFTSVRSMKVFVYNQSCKI